MLRSRRANAHLLVKFNAWTSQRLLNRNPVFKFNQGTQKYFRWVRYSQSRSRVPVANELMNSLMRKWFRLLKSFHKMNNLIFIFSLDSIIECLFDYSFFKNYTFHKSTSEFCFFSSFFLRVECGRVLKFKPKQTVKCTLFCCQWSVQETWPLRKHDGQTEVSVCAMIGGFRSSAIVSFFAFAVCQF